MGSGAVIQNILFLAHLFSWLGFPCTEGQLSPQALACKVEVLLPSDALLFGMLPTESIHHTFY
jgi:hypothetical protein